jgi:hypothetical protein
MTIVGTKVNFHKNSKGITPAQISASVQSLFAPFREKKEVLAAIKAVRPVN